MGYQYLEASLRTKSVKTYHVVVCELADVTRLDTKVLERLGVLIDDLVNVLHLDLLFRDNWPPQQLVQDDSNRLQDLPGHVDVLALVEDFSVDHLGNLGSRVFLGAVQLVGLRSRVVVVEHQFKSMADIDRVDGPVPLLHVVRCEEVGDASELQKKVVFETECWCGPHNGRFRVDAPDNLLTTTLGPEESYVRVGIGIVGRYMNEAIDVVFGHSLGDSCRAVNVHVLQREVPYAIVSTHQ